MGLGFYGSEIHFSYSGFMSYRIALASAVGINLLEMQGFADKGLSWKNIKEPLKDFLYHSDCDGELNYKQLKVIAPRLKEIASTFKYNNQEYYKITIQLVEYMENLIENKKTLIFC